MTQIPDKKYFKIGEVARIVGVKPHVIRYWESEFRQLRPTKSSTNQRIFARHHVELLLLIRALVHDEGFTLEGARRRLSEYREAGLSPSDLIDGGTLQRDALLPLVEAEADDVQVEAEEGKRADSGALLALIAALRPHLEEIRDLCREAPAGGASVDGDTLPISLRKSE